MDVARGDFRVLRQNRFRFLLCAVAVTLIEWDAGRFDERRSCAVYRHLPDA
jgi:hypothetical protein